MMLVAANTMLPGARSSAIMRDRIAHLAHGQGQHDQVRAFARPMQIPLGALDRADLACLLGCVRLLVVADNLEIAFVALKRQSHAGAGGPQSNDGENRFGHRLLLLNCSKL